MTTELIRQIIARSGLDAYNEEISAACDAIDAQMAKQLAALKMVNESIYVDDGGSLRLDSSYIDDVLSDCLGEA